MSSKMYKYCEPSPQKQYVCAHEFCGLPLTLADFYIRALVFFVIDLDFWLQFIEDHETRLGYSADSPHHFELQKFVFLIILLGDDYSYPRF